jgi:uncharacterized membrane protein
MSRKLQRRLAVLLAVCWLAFVADAVWLIWYAAQPAEAAPAPAESTASQSLLASITFDQHILPIFKAKCFRCHGTPPRFQSNLDLRSFASAKKGGSSGASGFVPGQPGNSEIWVLIEDNQMPPRGEPQLTIQEHDLIKKWISLGARQK